MLEEFNSFNWAEIGSVNQETSRLKLSDQRSKRKKEWKEWRQSMWIMRYHQKKQSTHNWSPEGKEREKGAENEFKDDR